MQMSSFSIELRPIVKYDRVFVFHRWTECRCVQVFVCECAFRTQNVLLIVYCLDWESASNVFDEAIIILWKESELLLVGDEKEEPHRRRTTSTTAAAAAAQASTMTFFTILRNSIFFVQSIQSFTQLAARTLAHFFSLSLTHRHILYISMSMSYKPRKGWWHKLLMRNDNTHQKSTKKRRIRAFSCQFHSFQHKNTHRHA